MRSNRLRVVGLAVWSLCAAAPAGAQTIAWTSDATSRLSDEVASDEYGHVTSLWIEQRGEVLYQAYFHGAGPDSLHNMRSVGKTVTGMLVGLAIDDGLIESVDVRAASFFDDLRPFENDDPRKDRISIEDLLTMSGSLECDDWNSFSRGNEERMYLVEDWSSFFWDLPIKNRPSWEIPEDDGAFGRLFAYCTAGVQLAGEIVERASGESAAAYAAARLFGPLGIDNPKWNFASSGKAHLGGGLELTTADWATVARLYLNRGRHDGTQVVPASWVDASFTDRVRIEEGTNYGYLWWRPRYELDGREYVANMMSGSGGNRVYVLPEFGIVAVVTKADFRDRDAHAKSDRLFAEVIVAALRQR